MLKNGITKIDKKNTHHHCCYIIYIITYIDYIMYIHATEKGTHPIKCSHGDSLTLQHLIVSIAIISVASPRG